MLLFKSLLYRRKNKNPYIKPNHKLKCIFIHIPKVAGISIEEAIFGAKVGHKKIINYKYYNPIAFKTYYKFTFVRNPLDRMVSAFFFLKKGGRNSADKRWAEENLANINTFNDLAYKMMNNKEFQNKILSWQHFRPQYTYIIDEDNQIPMDFIGKFENINNDFELLIKNLNIEARLPHKNKNDRYHFSYYYNDETIEFVSNLYEKDIQFFGY